mmetsp:Transcript_34287/g.61761  ORF Transcript_34287/g.61761 Transcript_34287/m.61761 type:complete len:93 (-) Transcript_34287:133-411(-)
MRWSDPGPAAPTSGMPDAAQLASRPTRDQPVQAAPPMPADADAFQGQTQPGAASGAGRPAAGGAESRRRRRVPRSQLAAGTGAVANPPKARE